MKRVLTFAGCLVLTLGLAAFQGNPYLTTPTIILPVISGGLTASGSVSNDFSGSTGAFKTSTGAVTLGNGAISITGLPTFTAGLLASGAVANDFSAATGAFLTSSGANTLSGATTVPGGSLTLGTAGTSAAALALKNATSGTVTIAPPTGALGTPTLTVPLNTGSLVTGTTCGASLAAAGACPNTTLGGNGHFFAGSFLLSGSTSTVTGISPAFTSATSWWCVANDVTTRANPVQAIPGSGTTLVITNTTGATDLIQVICAGN